MRSSLFFGAYQFDGGQFCYPLYIGEDVFPTTEKEDRLMKVKFKFGIATYSGTIPRTRYARPRGPRLHVMTRGADWEGNVAVDDARTSLESSMHRSSLDKAVFLVLPQAASISITAAIAKKTKAGCPRPCRDHYCSGFRLQLVPLSSSELMASLNLLCSWKRVILKRPKKESTAL